MAVAPTFYVVPGSAVKSAIEAHRKEVFDAVERAYRLHAARDAINPDSYFLRFPDKPMRHELMVGRNNFAPTLLRRPVVAQLLPSAAMADDPAHATRVS